ncbi:phage head closure protein [uncultured Methanobrevibacter sp.]|uniref:phage head closure protein n=1 Tax=uncultured Methanobrevibacter sp. TaxID=253161 RepID=UPI002613FE71|nr:phage head closure protein [uncultured Methanobrevibacter sp.]
MFRPSAPFNVAMKLLVPTTTAPYGAGKKVYTTPEQSSQFFGSFRTFGGTENISNGVLTTINTAVINTWYRTDIKADCQVYICETGEVYDIVSKPEDIDFRHQYLQFKVKKVGGKA